MYNVQCTNSVRAQNYKKKKTPTKYFNSIGKYNLLSVRALDSMLMCCVCIMWMWIFFVHSYKTVESSNFVCKHTETETKLEAIYISTIVPVQMLGFTNFCQWKTTFPNTKERFFNQFLLLAFSLLIIDTHP